jgi:hypothetical protein
MSQNCIPLHETGGANKLIAQKDTEWYLYQQGVKGQLVR